MSQSCRRTALKKLTSCVVVDTDCSKDREMMGETDEMDALVKDRLDQELDSLVPIADGPDFAARLQGLLAKSRTGFEVRGAMHRRAKS